MSDLYEACRKAVIVGDEALRLYRLGDYEMEIGNFRLAREYFESAANLFDEEARLNNLAGMLPSA